MNAVRNFVKNASPTVKMLMAISITSALAISHRLIYAPYVRRQRYRQAEEWANEILEEEERLKESGETYTSVGNLRY